MAIEDRNLEVGTRLVAGRSGSVRQSRQAAKVKRTRPGVGSFGVRRRGAAAPRTVALPLQGLPEALLREARHGHAVQQARLSRVGYRSLPVDDWLEGHQWNARWRPHPGLPPSPYGVAIGPQTARNLRPLQTGLLLEPLPQRLERFQEPIPVWLIPREIRIPVGAPASPIPSNVLALLVPSTDPAR